MLNPVLLSVCAMLTLSLMRVNVVVALTLSALIGGLTAGMSISETVSAFEGGLGGRCNYCIKLRDARRLCRGHL